MIHQHLVDLLLGVGVALSAFFSGVDQLGVLGYVFEKLGSGQVVIYHHLGPLDEFQPLHRDQGGVARACADEVDLAPGTCCFVVAVCCHNFSHEQKTGLSGRF